MANKEYTPEYISNLVEDMGLENPTSSGHKHTSRNNIKRQQRTARNTQAVTLRLSGLTYAQIGERMGISTNSAQRMVTRTLQESQDAAVDNLRSIENARLDRAQAAIWKDVLDGDLQAVQTFLRISDRRAKMNGLDAPQKVDMNLNVKQEMEQAITELESVLIQGEVIDDDDTSPQAVEAPHDTDNGTDTDNGPSQSILEAELSGWVEGEVVPSEADPEPEPEPVSATAPETEPEPETAPVPDDFADDVLEDIDTAFEGTADE